MNTHRIAHLAFALLAIAAFAYGARSGTDADPIADLIAREVNPVATPNHDPHRSDAIASAAAPASDELAAWNPVMLRAEPEAAAPAVAATAAAPTATAAVPNATGPSPSVTPDFVTADTMLYAKPNARLRTAPSTAANVVTKLAANAPLHAVARSSDGAWWQVALADSDTGTGYVHRDAVTTYQLITLTRPAAATTTGPVADASPSPEPWPSLRGQNLTEVVSSTKNWFVAVANRKDGSARKGARAER